jgi:hypothetical protein
MTTRDSPTKARQLIDGASFGPEALKALGEALTWTKGPS